MSRAEELIGAVYRRGGDRAALAALAPVVLEAAEDGDPISVAIVREATAELAAAARAATRPLGLGPRLPVALAGGLLVSFTAYRQGLLAALADSGLWAEPVTVVREPAEGAVRLALDLLPKAS
jgi:N-acetylglucosamine kinase-like BadF-type ATPase